MIIQLDVPKVTKAFFPGHWINVTLLNNRPADYPVHAIVSTYVRLVEAAFAQYELGRFHLEVFWNTHNAVAMGDYNMSGTHFESCINSMHRAILCMKQIRGGKQVPNDVKSLFPVKPSFLADSVANKLRRLRDMAQHMEERVLKGNIAAGTSFSLRADGPETPVIDSDQPNQTLKRIDRLILGDEELLILDLVEWLGEMRVAAELISDYKGPPAQSP